MPQFILDNINFLWIIPIIAFGFFIFLIQLLAQNKENKQDLSSEVARFNAGTSETTSASREPGADRLNQLERAISSVTDSLSAQQRAIEQFHRDNTSYTGEINDLKGKLRELYREYDIILSENYSLRAKVKKLEGGRDDVGEEQELPVELAPPPPSPEFSAPLYSTKVDMKLYEDTRTLNLSLLDDTSEIDISDLSRRSDFR